jgi:hypothetical protein
MIDGKRAVGRFETLFGESMKDRETGGSRMPPEASRWLAENSEECIREWANASSGERENLMGKWVDSIVKVIPSKWKDDLRKRYEEVEAILRNGFGKGDEEKFSLTDLGAVMRAIGSNAASVRPCCRKRWLAENFLVSRTEEELRNGVKAVLEKRQASLQGAKEAASAEPDLINFAVFNNSSNKRVEDYPETEMWGIDFGSPEWVSESDGFSPMVVFGLEDSIWGWY